MEVIVNVMQTVFAASFRRSSNEMTDDCNGQCIYMMSCTKELPYVHCHYDVWGYRV